MSRSRLLSSPRSFLFSTGVTRPGSGIRLGFRPVDEGDGATDSPGATNFFMVITDISERKIMITFHNQSPVNCIISDIIFADGGLYSISVQSARGSLEPGKLACAIDTGTVGHQDLPGPDRRYGNHQLASYDTAAPDALQDGIKPNESLGIIFDLQAGITLVDVLGALSREKLNISLKLLDAVPGSAGILINEPNLGLSTSW
jgi:hypothetical protein